MPLRASCSDGANRPDAELKSESHWHKVSVRSGGDATCPFLESREFGLGDNSSRNPGSAGADVAHSAQSHGRESRGGNSRPSVPRCRSAKAPECWFVSVSALLLLGTR